MKREAQKQRRNAIPVAIFIILKIDIEAKRVFKCNKIK